MSGGPPASGAQGQGATSDAIGKAHNVLSGVVSIVILLGALGGLIGGVVNWYYWAATKPVGGWSFLSKSEKLEPPATVQPALAPIHAPPVPSAPAPPVAPAADAGATSAPLPAKSPEPTGCRCVPEFSIRKIEVLNPGPGDLRGLQLEVTVCDHRDHDKQAFPSGLLVKYSSGVSIDYQENGGDTRVIAMPDAAHSGGALQRNQRFSVEFDSPEAKWEPVKAVLVLPGQEEIDVNHVFPNVGAHMPVDYILWYSPWALAFFGLAFFVYRRWRVPAEIEKQVLRRTETEVAARKDQIWSQAWNECLQQQAKATPRPAEVDAQILEMEREIQPPSKGVPMLPAPPDTTPAG